MITGITFWKVIAQACDIGWLAFEKQLSGEAIIVVSLYVYHTGQYKGQPIK